MDTEIMARLREVVDMNVCWQQAYKELTEKVSQMEIGLIESNQREVELTGKVDCMLAESNRRENVFTKKVDRLLEEIELLKIQAITYKEDFDIERKQRSELGGKLIELQQELNLVQETKRVRPAQMIVRIPNQVYCVYQTDGSRDEPDTVTDTHDATCMSLLYCPKCHRSFTVDEHRKLVDHMDVC